MKKKIGKENRKAEDILESIKNIRKNLEDQILFKLLT